MKKFLLLLIIFLVIINHAAVGAEIHGNFETAYDFISNSVIGHICLIYEFNLLTTKQQIYGGWDTLYKLNIDTIQATDILVDTYSVGYKIIFDNRFYIDFYHFCSHPILVKLKPEPYSISTYEQIENKYHLENALTTIAVGIRW